MNLNLVNGIFNNLKENKFVQDFINELSNYLEGTLKKNLNFENKEVPIIENIIAKNNLTTGNKNSIIWKENEIILQYAKNNFSKVPMYFVKDSKKTYWSNNKEHYNNGVYSVLKVENNIIKEIEISKKDIPKNIGVNDVFKIENGNYIIDTISTQELQKEIMNMAQEIIDKQNISLAEHRKEGHLYMVTEEVGNNRFLWDLTDVPKFEFEEVDLPKELLEKATQGIVLKYINGGYEYYSSDGFERSEKINKKYGGS